MSSLTKNRHLPTKKFFFKCRLERIAASFDTLTRSVGLTGPEKFRHKATCVSVFFSRKSPKAARRQSVNTYSRVKAENKGKTLYQVWPNWQLFEPLDAALGVFRTLEYLFFISHAE